MPNKYPPQPPRELVDFVKRQIRDRRSFDGSERREESRDLKLLHVLAQPVDEDRRPLGDPLAMVTRDISSTGVGLVYPDRIPHDLVALQLELGGEEIVLLTRIVWRKPLGPFYYLGGKFLTRLDRFPTKGA